MNIKTLQVIDDTTVSVIHNDTHKFLMSVRDVALGYGVSSGNIRNQMFRNQDELKEGKHFVKGVSFSNTLSNTQPHAIYWTKEGVIRLSFFIKSERAKLFRDWAESVITQALTPQINVQLPQVQKRNHNRLTQERMISILADVAKIDNKELRLSIIEKLLN